MRIGRLITYALVALVSGAVGFLFGGGALPDRLRAAPHELATQARESAEALHQEETTVTGVLNDMRERVADGVRRVTGFLDD